MVAGEPFCDLSYVLENITNSSHHKATLQYRPRRFMFGAHNYGEVIGLRNRADGDRWDIFAPGYNRRLPVGRPYQIKDIMGVLKLANKNHKIAVRLYIPGFDAKSAEHEIERFCAQYTAKVGVQGTYHPLSRDGTYQV